MMKERRAGDPSRGSTALALMKLILWLFGLLVALVTMNLTVYLLLTGVYLGAKAVRRAARAKLKSAVDEVTGRSSTFPSDS